MLSARAILGVPLLSRHAVIILYFDSPLNQVRHLKARKLHASMNYGQLKLILYRVFHVAPPM
jgi:hypothetical protein